MTNDLAGRLAEHRIELPELSPLARSGPGAGVLAFSSAGEEALDWWRRLRAVSERTGYWPLLLDEELAGFLAEAPIPAVEDGKLDGAEILTRRGGTSNSLDDAQRRELLDMWPAEPYREDAFRLPFSPTGQPYPVRVALCAGQGGYDWSTVLGYGTWNESPPPAEHRAVLRHWHESHGAELVCMTTDSVELAMSRPPSNKQDALDFAWEYASYCPDGVDAIYYSDDLAQLAASLLGAEVVLAWWD
jgi:hypothetical protein